MSTSKDLKVKVIFTIYHIKLANRLILKEMSYSIEFKKLITKYNVLSKANLILDKIVNIIN